MALPAMYHSMQHDHIEPCKDRRIKHIQPAFLDKEVRSQCSNVFKVPSLVGTTAMFLLFAMILYANDGRMVMTEWAAMGICLCIIALVGGAIYAVYRSAVKGIKRQLQV